ncbi:MAG: DUF2182 domain-containing protein [Steroidobacteraceae bacterium]
MVEASVIERLLKRDRTITLLGVAVLAILAWLYLLAGAGLGMSAWRMTTLALFPHEQAAHWTMPDMPEMDVAGMATGSKPWEPATWALMIAMWWVMMIAMMAPGATPAILLFARVHHEARASGRIEADRAPTGAFAAGYLSVWLAFAVAATALHRALEHAGLITAALMGSQSRWLSGSVLIAAGVYQLSPMKQACLAHCRAPATFLARHWRPGSSGAFRLGVRHGAYCVGCCWFLMALLFVGGVMNVVWIAALATLVLLEKAWRRGRWTRHGAGIVLIAWGLASLLV